MIVTVDNYTRVLLTIIAVLLLVTGVGLWHESPPTVKSAYGAIPDSGQQLNVLIQKADSINASLDNIVRLLTSGNVKVQMVLPKDAKGKSQVPMSIGTPAK